MTTHRRFWRWSAAAGLAVLAGFYYAYTIGPQIAFEHRHVYYSDFGRFHFSTRQFLEGRPMYVPVPAEFRAKGQELRQRTDLTPPHSHLVFLPIAWLPLPLAWPVWMGINLLATILCGSLVRRELAIDLDLPALVAATALALISAPGVALMTTGQPTMVYALVLATAWRASRRGQETIAGACLGLLCSVKPFFGVFPVYFAARRNWSGLGAAVAASVASFVIGIAVFGFEAHAGWLRDLGSVTWLAHPLNSSALGLAARGAWPLWVTVLALGGAVAAAIRAIRATTMIDRHWLVLLATAMLLSPLGWVYYWPWLAIPAVAVWRESEPETAGGRIALALGCASAWWPVEWARADSVLEALTIGSVYTWGMLLTVCGLALSARVSQRRQEPALGAITA